MANTAATAIAPGALSCTSTRHAIHAVAQWIATVVAWNPGPENPPHSLWSSQ